MLLGLLSVLYIFVAFVYGFFAVMRMAYSGSAGYSSLRMTSGCMLIPFFSIAGFALVNWLCQVVDSMRRCDDYLLYEFAFSLIAVSVVGWLHFGRNRKMS